MHIVSLIFLAANIIALSEGDNVPQVVEMPRENCTDPNAEFRNDNPDCVVTCGKKSLTENPASCFKNTKLKPGCYCKQNYVLNEKSNKCVMKEACPCNPKNMEQSRFSNQCANGCGTYMNRSCSPLLHMDCWCMFTYCRSSNGTCVSKP